MGSPQIFFQSGLCEKLPAIGRYLSFHCGVFGIRIQFRKKETTQLKTKQLGSTEYYFGTKSMRHKLGLIQDIPLPGSFSIKEGGNSNVQSRLLQQAFASFKQRSQSFGMIIEDIPQASNMLRFTGDSQRVRLCHSFHHYDLWRLQLARKLLKEMLTDKETVSCLLFDSVLQKSLLSHAVGTLRSGKSLKNSVVDSNGKVHGIDNVFVTDGSVLPTSMGVGPALTIVANAFRISQKI
jgi:choline dehydrogenase-like flavoprotein